MKIFDFFKSLFQSDQSRKSRKSGKTVKMNGAKRHLQNAPKNLTGKIKYFNRNRGYGFIESEAIDNRIFVHISDLQMKARVGKLVKFNLEKNNRGYQAKNVVQAS